MRGNMLVLDVLKEKFKSVISFIEKNSLIISLAALFLGISITAFLPSMGEAVSNVVEALIGAYGYFVPFLIYFLLTPALIKLIALAKKHGNGWLISVLRHFVVARFLAILFAITALTLIFRLPFYLNQGASFTMALGNAAEQLIKALFFSPLLYGVYAAVITMAVSFKIKIIKDVADKAGDGVEYLGGLLMILSPLFMFGVGSFFYHLPVFLETNFSQNFSGGMEGVLQTLHSTIIGFNLIPSKFIFVALYLLIGLTTGLLCIIWHGLYIVYARWVEPKFSLRYYLKKYWMKVYPLLWSSSSETLAVPLSLNLMKKNFPDVPSEIRQFVITSGSYLGINGTLISAYVMGVFLAYVVGADISFFQLLLSLPVIFILGYAVPGIPGELIIFAGTMSILLGIPGSVTPLFMALYLTLQIGLSDSFRTGCNSTDSALLAIISTRNLEKMKARAHVHVPYNTTGVPQLSSDEKNVQD